MNKGKKYIFLLIFCVFLQFFYINLINCKQGNFAFGLENDLNKIQNNDKITSAKAMITMESNSGRILYEKGKNKRLPMASTTKIITAIVAIENCKNLDEKHEIPANSIGIEGSSIYLRKNEHLSIRELLYGLMLRSGNDSAVAIAIIIGGSVENFVKMMNDFCLSLNLKDTNLVTVNGLHDDNHYTTAYDLAIITRYALKNKIFAEIVSTNFIKISDDNAKDKVRYLKNKNKLLSLVDGADGVKTGYTKKAGKCFVGSASRGKMQIICVVLDCTTMFDDCAKLIEKAFSEYKMIKLFSRGNIHNFEIKNGKNLQTAPVVLNQDIYYPLSNSEINAIKAKMVLKDNLSVPLESDSEIGELEIYLENDLIFSQKVYTINIEKIKEESYFKKILKAFW